ncbi:MAG: hypothetical protein M3O70_27290 [Actinomycetota bacterium]|nr:hypothetical protein [Actinomycetota bacterium]
MDLKTIIAVAPFLRRLYRKLPRPLRVFAVLLALVVGVKKLFGDRGEEPVAEGTHEAGAQAGEQTG